MRKLAIAMLGALALSGMVMGSAVAQDKKAAKPKFELKVIADNDKVRVFETKYAPGAENPSPPSSNTRVVRTVSPGQLTRIYADGKKEVIDWKPGMVQVLGPSGPYTTKNTGKTTLQLYVVVVK